MKLFIGNCTKQRREFYYRVPGEALKQVHDKLTILPGRQEQIPGEHTRVVLEGILEKQLKYGFAEASSLSRNKAYVGMCYSFDKPISESLLSYVFEANDDKLDQTASEEMRKFAIATGVQFDKPEVQELGLRQIDVSVTDTKNKPSDDKVLHADGYEMTGQRSAQPAPRRRRAG